MRKAGILLQILITVAIALVEARNGESKPIKSFRNKNGRIIDCIDIHKQPAFNNPLLTNHKIQMQPSYIPVDSLNQNSETDNVPMLETVECPFGTVPIQRNTRQHVKKSRQHFRYAVHDATTPAKPTGHFYALVTGNEKTSIPFYGAHGMIDVYSLNVLYGQFSQSMIRLGNGVDGIEFGWNVHPELYGDNDTHTYSYWTVDGFKTGCYNTDCPGFVQVDTRYILGAKVSPVSTYGGPAVAIFSLVFKDPKTSNWWITVQVNGTNYSLGYWPASLFTGLANHATDVYLGGAVYSADAKPLPPMGSGNFAPDDLSRTCFISDIRVVDASNKTVQLEKNKIITYSNAPDCYKVSYGFIPGSNYYYTMVFGGPGGSDCKQ